MKHILITTIAASILLVGSLFLVQAQEGKDKVHTSHLTFNKPLREGNPEQLNVRGLKDNQLQFRQWLGKVDCFSCHKREKKKESWKLIPLHENGKRLKQKWLRKTDCFSCHETVEGKGMLLWPRLHGFKPLKTVSKEGSSSSSSSSSSTINSTTTYVVSDSKRGELRYNDTNGEATLKVVNPDGKVLFDGPINTKEQKAKVPTKAMKWFDEVNSKVKN